MVNSHSSFFQLWCKKSNFSPVVSRSRGLDLDPKFKIQKQNSGSGAPLVFLTGESMLPRWARNPLMVALAAMPSTASRYHAFCDNDSVPDLKTASYTMLSWWARNTVVSCDNRTFHMLNFETQYSTQNQMHSLNRNVIKFQFIIILLSTQVKVTSSKSSFLNISTSIYYASALFSVWQTASKKFSACFKV